MGELDGLLIHTCDVKTIPETKSAAGFAVKGTPTTKASAVPCRRERLDLAAQVEYGRLGLKVNELLFFDTDQSLTISDELVFADATLEVKSVTPAFAQDGTTPHHWEVLALQKAT